MRVLFWCLGCLMLLQPFEGLQAATYCEPTQQALRRALERKDVSYEAQQWSVQGQRYQALALWLSAEQLRQLLQELGMARDGVFFTHLEEQQLWLLHHEHCVFSLQLPPEGESDIPSTFIFMLDPDAQASGWLGNQTVPLALLHHYHDARWDQELLIYLWEPGKAAQVQQLLQKEGIAAHYVTQCMPLRLCFLMHNQRSITLLWSHYQGQDYWLVWIQGCEDCDVEAG